MANKITDLRSAIEFLKTFPGQYAETDTPIKPHAEVSGVYRYVGAGGTVKRPTKKGPALCFNTVEGHPGARVLIGMLASRERVALMLGESPQRLGHLLNEAVRKPILPVIEDDSSPQCREVIHLANEPGFDVRKLVPAPTNTPEDGGPYITLGMAYASDPDTKKSDITIHRLCLQGSDTISIYMVPGARHIGAFFQKAEAKGKPLPISISIGVDPAIEVTTCFEPPTTPIGYDELGVAGAIRGAPVKLVKCLTVDEKCIANAEYVIEGEILPNVRIREDQSTNTGYAMPEFPGYTGPANPSVPLIKVKAVTHRRNPILQTCIGPSEEHVSMAGIPTEASILQMVENAMPGRLLNVYCHSGGGGKYMAILQFAKRMPSDEGRQRQAALLAFAAFSELKHVILVDEDVDPFDSSDVLFALNTRYQGDIDTIFIPGVRCHPLDPSQTMAYNPALRDNGLSCKTIFDCTVPFKLKEQFTRAKLLDLDPAKWAPDF
ncbi:MAG: UbiD family decarboxylase [Synergistaceae bacterium]|nr:UbiD family decarboxylase [Synergistaceae bacterium]